MCIGGLIVEIIDCIYSIFGYEKVVIDSNNKDIYFNYYTESIVERLIHYLVNYRKEKYIKLNGTSNFGFGFVFVKNGENVGEMNGVYYIKNNNINGLNSDGTVIQSKPTASDNKIRLISSKNGTNENFEIYFSTQSYGKIIMKNCININHIDQSIQ